nr:hypothetical protein RFYW14_04067 [Pseudorhizobium flavum]
MTRPMALARTCQQSAVLHQIVKQVSLSPLHMTLWTSSRLSEVGRASKERSARTPGRLLLALKFLSGHVLLRMRR